MSDAGEDPESKTEDATQHRIDEALEKGNAPFSREVGSAVAFLVVGAAFTSLVSSGSITLSQYLGFYLDHAGDIQISNGGDVVALLEMGLTGTAIAIIPILLTLMISGIVSSVIQVRPRLLLERLLPDFSRISGAGAFKRLFKAQSVPELVRSFCKLAIFAFVFDFLILERIPSFVLLASTPVEQLGWVLADRIRELLLIIGGLLAVVAVGDVLWARHKWSSDLRMTHQEIKDEYKQTEGDPRVRARVRAAARQQARKRMMAAVPKATLVVANPTHYAVAIRYVQGEMDVPVVLAKGLDHLALRIRMVAAQHHIPVVENKLLARALFESADENRPIPADFYKAVAEIILFVWGRKRPAHTTVQSPNIVINRQA